MRRRVGTVASDPGLDFTDGVRAVAYRLRRVMRAHWPATLALTAVVALVSAVVLTIAAGAHRTMTAPDRYTAARGVPFDALVVQDSGRPRTAEVASLPGASSVASITFVFGGLLQPGSPDPLDTSTLAGSHLPTGLRLVSGRVPDPKSTEEFVATRSFVDVNHVAIGDRFRLVTLTPEQAATSGFDTEKPGGPTSGAVLVGIIDGPASLDDPSPAAVFASALLDDARIGIAVTIMSASLRPGTDLAAFRAELDRLPDANTLNPQRGVLVSKTARTAVNAQGIGLWALATVTAIAAVVALGQVITRQVRMSSIEQSRLRALGLSAPQLLAESAGRAGVPVVAGAALGALLATLASGAFPTGFVRRVEPHPGLRIDPVVLVLGTTGLAAALLGWIVATLWLARRTRDGARPSGLVDAIATRSPSATAALGVRFAFTKSARDGGSVRGTVAGVALVAAGLVGSLTFASSLHRLVGDPARFGADYDLVFGDSGADTVSPEVRARLDADRDVAALSLYGTGQARVGSDTLRLVGVESVKGRVAPRLLAGRLPSGEDELALGRLAAETLGARVGHDLTLRGDRRTQRVRVTGIVVVPSMGINDGVGQDGLVTLAGLQRLQPSATASTAVVDLRRGAPAATADRLSRLTGVRGGPPGRPTAIVNLARIRSIPFLLAGLLGILAALTVAQVMLTSVRQRQRDLAVVRTLGADRRWAGRAVHWQASASVLLPSAFAAPLGVVAGSFVFGAFAASLGAVEDASTPYVLVAVVIAGLLVVANGVAAVPARRARRRAPGRLLRAE